MVAKTIQLEEALALQLSPLDKVRLLERVALTLESDLSASNEPFETFEGALAHLGTTLSNDDIAKARRNMMRNFPTRVDS